MSAFTTPDSILGNKIREIVERIARNSSVNSEHATGGKSSFKLSKYMWALVDFASQQHLYILSPQVVTHEESSHGESRQPVHRSRFVIRRPSPMPNYPAFTLGLIKETLHSLGVMPFSPNSGMYWHPGKNQGSNPRWLSLEFQALGKHRLHSNTPLNPLNTRPSILSYWSRLRQAPS